MNLQQANIFVTNHATSRYRERLGKNLPPEEIAELCKRSKAVSVSARRRYRLRWSGPDNERMIWQRYRDAFYLVRGTTTGEADNFVLVTVVSIAHARQESKRRGKELTAQGRRKK